MRKKNGQARDSIVDSLLILGVTAAAGAFAMHLYMTKQMNNLRKTLATPTSAEF